MKKIIIITFILAGVAGLLVGQGVFTSAGSAMHFTKPYEIRSSPPMGLADAYSTVIAYLGPKTNYFHCFAASCTEKTSLGLPGWTFSFANTNGERANIAVAFDKIVGADAATAELLYRYR
jgi:hypothetical protein